MKFLSYESCKRINALKLAVRSNWYWATHKEVAGDRRYYGLFLKHKDDPFLTYFFPAYSFDNFPLLFARLQKKSLRMKGEMSVHEVVEDLAGVLSRHGWAKMEKALMEYVKAYEQHATMDSRRVG